MRYHERTKHHFARSAQAAAHITVENPNGASRGVSSATLDGNSLPSGLARVPLVDDGATRNVHVILG